MNLERFQKGDGKVWEEFVNSLPTRYDEDIKQDALLKMFEIKEKIYSPHAIFYTLYHWRFIDSKRKPIERELTFNLVSNQDVEKEAIDKVTVSELAPIADVFIYKAAGYKDREQAEARGITHDAMRAEIYRERKKVVI